MNTYWTTEELKSLMQLRAAHESLHKHRLRSMHSFMTLKTMNRVWMFSMCLCAAGLTIGIVGASNASIVSTIGIGMGVGWVFAVLNAILNALSGKK